MDNQEFTNGMLWDILHDFPTDAKVYIRDNSRDDEYCVYDVGLLIKPNGEKELF